MPARRILICNYEYPPLGGGGGTCSRAFARELLRLGHRVEVVTARFRGQPPDIQRGRFRLRRLPALRGKLGQSNPVEMMSYVASAVPYLLLRRGPRPDVAISFHSIPSGMAAWPLSVLRGVPHIVLFRGGDVPGWLPGELQLYHRATLWLNRLIVDQAALALANSDGLRDLAQKSFPRTRIGVLYNGVDPGTYKPPAEGRDARTGPVRLVFAGRITTQKGIDTMLDALGGLRALDWTLEIGGDGPEIPALSAQAERLGIADRVAFLGWLSREGVAELYRRGDVLIFPSRYEGMPNVVLEGIASGLPVVGTRIAGTEQIIEPEANGLMVEPDDVPALREAIRRLVEDRALRLRLGEEARRRAVETWSWKGRAKELEAKIESVLSSPRPRT